jgi:hypothetical protein
MRFAAKSTPLQNSSSTQKTVEPKKWFYRFLRGCEKNYAVGMIVVR